MIPHRNHQWKKMHTSRSKSQHSIFLDNSLEFWKKWKKQVALRLWNRNRQWWLRSWLMCRHLINLQGYYLAKNKLRTALHQRWSWYPKSEGLRVSLIRKLRRINLLPQYRYQILKWWSTGRNTTSRTYPSKLLPLQQTLDSTIQVKSPFQTIRVQVLPII